jgi:hypothetical protein
MHEIPMLYSTPMVIATKAGRKTKTRRTKGFDEIVNNNPDEWKLVGVGDYKIHVGDKIIKSFGASLMWKPTAASYFFKCPYGEPGDIIWVRESFYGEKYFNGLTEGCFIKFKADYEGPVDWNWKPSIHMPKAVARIWLQITDIKAERLHDITEEDAIAEGVKHAHDWRQPGVKVETLPDGSHVAHGTKSFRRGFSLLWDDINGRESWNANPWVWVISFKVLSTTGKPDES